MVLPEASDRGKEEQIAKQPYESLLQKEQRAVLLVSLQE